MTEAKDMFEQISAILTDKKDKPFSYEELAAMLKTDPDALKTFDEVYKTQVLESGELHENMLQWDTATVKAILDKRSTSHRNSIRSLTASSQNWCLKRVCTSTTRNAVAIM